MNVYYRPAASAFAALSLGALLLSGCKTDSAAKRSETSPAGTTSALPPAAPVDPAQAATIAGVVHFSGTPQPRVHIDMSMDPACSLTGGDNLSEQYMVQGGDLANVFVYVKSGIAPSSAAAGAAPVHVDQHGCRFIPHVSAVQQGGSVAFTNSDPTMHNVHTMPTAVGNASVDVSQGPGSQPQVRQFPSSELMLPIRCNNHPWMNAFLNIAPNPYFAVSAANGSFTIGGLPPGTYTLAAVHEKLGEQDVQVTVPAHTTTAASFTFGPK